MIYPIFYDLVAQTASERQRASQLPVNIVRNIQENDWYLVDVSGNRTTWGVWNPKQLNDLEFWYDGRGVNSLQIMSWLPVAYRFTQDSYFQGGFDQLVQKHQYDLNIVNAKIMQPSDINYSDDELTYLPYFTYIWNFLRTRQDPLGEAFDLSMERTFFNVKRVRSPLWNFIYLVYKKEMRNETDIPASVLEDAIWALQTLPIEQIDWPVDNSQREDIQFDQSVDRFGKKSLRNLIPYDENSVYRWNASPFDLSDGSGHSICDASVFLTPFWLGYYFMYI